MARLTRRAGLAAAGVTVAAALAARKFLPGLAPSARPGQALPPGVDMRPLSDIAVAKPPTAMPALVFRTLDGGPAPLAAYAGRPVVLNFWATWCVPCVAELPELDRLAADGKVAVLAVSADRAGAAVVRPFIAAHAIARATVLLDPGSEAVHALQVAGFPTTLLIGPDLRLRGTLEGPARWGEAASAIAALLG